MPSVALSFSSLYSFPALLCFLVFQRIVAVAMPQVVGTVSAAAAAGTRHRGVLPLYPWPVHLDVSLASDGIREILTSPARTGHRSSLLSKLQLASAMLLLPRLASSARAAAGCYPKARYGAQLREETSQRENMTETW